MTKNNINVDILLVEDDPGHARLIEKNLRRGGIANTIHIIDNGRKAMDYLFCEGEHKNNRHEAPLLVLLDLNLPEVDGYTILERLKSSDKTREIPVVMLTTTGDNGEVSRCYKLGCNVFVTKPVDYDQFSEAIARLGLFLSIVVVPERNL